MEEAQNTRIILNKCARRKIALVTSEKLGKTSFLKVADVSAIDEIITDKGADRGIVTEFRNAGVKVTVLN